MQLQRMWEGFEDLGCIRNFPLTQSRALFPSLLKMRIDEWGPNGFAEALIGNLNHSLCLKQHAYASLSEINAQILPVLKLP